MINIPAPKLGSFKSRPVAVLNVPIITKNPINDSHMNLVTLKVDTKTTCSKIINVQKTQLPKYEQTLQWRNKTQFPIVKVKNWKLLQEKLLDSENQVEILIELDGSLKSLEDFQAISFVQSIYIMKESLIGFQRLCYHFGSFHVDSSMIKFNETGICKVWINKDCYSNDFRPREVQSQKDFIFQLCSIIKGRITKSSSAKNFFDSIQTCQYFCKAIGAIESFTKQNLISVPSSLQNLEDCKSPMLKKSANAFPSKHEQNMTILSQMPAFLKRNQLKRDNSIQRQTPSPKKNLAAKKTSLFDRSLTDVSRKFGSFALSKKPSFNEQKSQENQKKDGSMKGLNQFFQGLNIRVNEAKQNNQRNVLSLQKLPFMHNMNNQTQINSESIKHLLGPVSDIGSSEQIKSDFFLNRSKDRQKMLNDDTNTNIRVKVTQPKRLNGSLLPNPTALLFKHRYSKEFNENEENSKYFRQNQLDKETLSPNIHQAKQKRKYSGEIGTVFGQEEKEKTESKAKKVPSFLNSLKNKINIKSVSLAKSPSLHIISPSQNQTGSAKKDKTYLRQTLMVVSGLEMTHKKQEQQTKQTAIEEKPKPKAKKLAFLGRSINESSDTEEAEFELEYGTKMKKEQSIRNEILGILN